MDAVRAYAHNSSSMWRYLRSGRAEARRHGNADVLLGEEEVRVNVVDPTYELLPEALEALRLPGSAALEDPYAQLDLPGFERAAWPILHRDRSLPTPAAQHEVSRVEDPADLAVAEHTIVFGFPLPHRQPDLLLPGGFLDVPGFDAWLVRRGGDPAAACLTLDDGNVVCVFWLATIPEHRSQGVGRSVMAAVIAAHPERDVVLVASSEGRPLYDSMGFTHEGTGAFHTPARSNGGVRRIPPTPR